MDRLNLDPKAPNASIAINMMLMKQYKLKFQYKTCTGWMLPMPPDKIVILRPHKATSTSLSQAISATYQQN